MDYGKLIERLRGYCQEWEAYRQEQYRRDLEDAAEGISKIYRLQTENEKLRAELADLRAQWDMYGGDDGITAIYAELKRVKAERDAAISDLTCIARTYPVELCDDLVCQYCKHYPNINAGCPGWTDDDCFEWHGIKED